MKSPTTPLFGERTDAEGKSITNKILLSVPDREYHLIRPYLARIELDTNEVLHERSELLRFVYFPNSGLISLVVPMENGQAVEAGVIGREGATGIPLAVGVIRSPLREIVQVAGGGHRLEASAMQSLRDLAPRFTMMLARYSIVRSLQLSQIAACNRLHRVDQRFARWLLMAQDRLDSSHITMTHDSFATMLGTNRPTVSSAAAVLQKRKCIDSIRGGVNITNRKKLETCACECYRAIQQFNGYLGIH